jgi:hypothetical protein
MKVIATHNPVVYSNAFGDGQFMNKVKGFVNKQKSEGSLFNKAKGMVGKFKDGQGQGGGAQQSAPVSSYTPPPLQPPPAPTPQGMSKGMKTGLIVGGVAVVLTLVIVVAVKMNKSGK